MSERTLNEVISDVESWAHDRLRVGEEFIFLGSEQTKGAGDKGIGIREQAIVKESEIPTVENKVDMKTNQIPIPQSPIPISDDWQNATDLDTLKSLIENCTKCPLHLTRTKFVFGVGNPNAKVMVIGEAPGADEDKKGEPFVGRAGQLLDKMIAAINFPREEVFIANILKSRPPGNRDPQPAEIAACEPYLWKQIDIIKPKMILCMGRVAGMNLLKNGIDTLKEMRGNVYDFRGAKVMVTYHPAALLRNSTWKPAAWEDLQKFRKIYDEMMAEA